MKVTTSYRPQDGTPIGSLPDTPAVTVLALVQRAVEATSEMASRPPVDRREWLAAVAEALERNEEELVTLAAQETGLPPVRLVTELARAAGQLRFYGDVAAEGSYLGVAIDQSKAGTPRLVRVNRPRGPVAVFGASNFPFAFSVVGNDTASALAAGCPVLVKAHPAHPFLSVRLGELAAEALKKEGAPAGAFSLVLGQQAGVDLVQADGIEAIAFTGSQTGGLALWRIANQRRRVVPVYAEMGTINPVVVTPLGMERFAEVSRGFVDSFTMGNGQYCTKPGLMFVPRGHNASGVVAHALAEAAPRPTMLTQAIASSVEVAIAELLAAGARLVRALPGADAGWSAPAAVLSAPIEALRPESRLLEECFGAIALVVEYANTCELRAALGALQGGLAATVIAGGDADPDTAWLLETLSDTVGRVTVGDWPTGVAFTWAQHHGGPWPATTNAAATSVGAAALDRFMRPITYQSVPDPYLPAAGRSNNPWNLPRRVDGRLELPNGESS